MDAQDDRRRGFPTAMTPLIFGGKIYNALKALMGVKLVLVIGFLLLLAVFYSRRPLGPKSSAGSSSSATCRSNAAKTAMETAFWTRERIGTGMGVWTWWSP